MDGKKMSDDRYPEHARYEHRRSLPYFNVVRQWIMEYKTEKIQTIMDVGSHDCPIVGECPPDFAERVAVDLIRGPGPRWPNVRFMKGDFMKLGIVPARDMVLCLHVIEHAKDPRAMADRLLCLTNDILIIGAPAGQECDRGSNPDYPEDHHVHHRHWGIDFERLYDWFGINPDKGWCEGGRLLAAYRRPGW